MRGPWRRERGGGVNCKSGRPRDGAADAGVRRPRTGGSRVSGRVRRYQAVMGRLMGSWKQENYELWKRVHFYRISHRTFFIYDINPYRHITHQKCPPPARAGPAEDRSAHPESETFLRSFCVSFSYLDLVQRDTAHQQHTHSHAAPRFTQAATWVG